MALLTSPEPENRITATARRQRCRILNREKAELELVAHTHITDEELLSYGVPVDWLAAEAMERPKIE